MEVSRDPPWFWRTSRALDGDDPWTLSWNVFKDFPKAYKEITT